MKYVSIAAVALVALLAAGWVAGCGGAKTPAVYGREIPSDMPATSAGDILADPAAFDGKDVVVAGKITSECPSGGWIWITDGTGNIYVNMHPTNVFIPQRVGRRVRVLGRVVLESGSPQVVGYGLEL